MRLTEREAVKLGRGKEQQQEIVELGDRHERGLDLRSSSK